jgi:hypothetical protein
MARRWHERGPAASAAPAYRPETGSDLGKQRAGEGNRTLMTSLEGCGLYAPELLRPRSENVRE